MRADLIKELQESKVIFGPKRTLKFLKKGLVKKIYLASDAPAMHLKEKNVEIITLDVNKENLKEICKKNFNISVISVLKNES